MYESYFVGEKVVVVNDEMMRYVMASLPLLTGGWNGALTLSIAMA